LRTALVSALAGCCERRLRTHVRRFLTGLSADELQFIAGFLGACILESTREIRCPGSHLATYGECAECSGGLTEDHNHKMILVREFLYRGGLRPAASPVRANHA
jgi:hypothetical protein